MSLLQMYDIAVRKLALRMVQKVGLVQTAIFTNISRSTLWRWKRYGVDPRKRKFESRLFEENKEILRNFLLCTNCTTARGIVAFFKQMHNIRLCTKTVYKFIKMLGFSRKRTKCRGQCKGDLKTLTTTFCNRYNKALNESKCIVSIDECGFSERLKPVYGYSPVGQPVILKTSGGWVHHSLLMAVYSDGRKQFSIKKGSVNKKYFTEFVDSLDLQQDVMVVLDNASIHKNLDMQTRPDLCYTPPYSPEFNAIELCFSNIKRYFRKLNIGTQDNVHDLIRKAIDYLSIRDVMACFDHVKHVHVRKGV
jgi:transposase